MTLYNACAAIESFCTTLAERVPTQITPFLEGRKNRITQRDLHQSPERFVSENLVWPLLDALELEFMTEVYLPAYNGRVDFSIQNTSTRILGEVKSFNHYEKGVSDLRRYLSHDGTETAFGIATDGVNWVFFREPDDRRRKIELLEYYTLRPALFNCWVTQGAVSPDLAGRYVLWHSTVGEYGEHSHIRSVPVEQCVREFWSLFHRDFLDTRIKSCCRDGQHDVALPIDDDQTTLHEWGFVDE